MALLLFNVCDLEASATVRSLKTYKDCQIKISAKSLSSALFGLFDLLFAQELFCPHHFLSSAVKNICSNTVNFSTND